MISDTESQTKSQSSRSTFESLRPKSMEKKSNRRPAGGHVVSGPRAHSLKLSEAHTNIGLNHGPERRRSFLSIRGITALIVLLALLTCQPFRLEQVLDISQLSHQTLRRYAVCSNVENIFTVDPRKPRAQCLVVRGSRIDYTGSLDDIRKSHGVFSILHKLGMGIKVYHIPDGSIIVPGLADAHAHILPYGFKMNLPLDGATSVDDVVQRVRSYIEARPDVIHNATRWIEGMGWDQTKWPGSQFPSAADLDSDRVLAGRPIALQRVDGHAIWVSSRVLELMGDLPDRVDGGEIIRDSSGKPTGIFIDQAMSLVPRPEWTEEQMAEYFEVAMRDAVRHGLTSIHDAGSSPFEIEFFKRLSEDGRLPIRLYVMGLVESKEYWGDQIERLTDYGIDGRLNVRSIKLVVDGALGSWGAALLEPYSDNANVSGLVRIAPDTFEKWVNQFWEDGWQVNTHAIGDRANKLVLDIYEDILERRGGNVSTWRPRIEHAQIMTLGDLERTGRLGVIASVQPTHATSDMSYAESRLGATRLKGAYAYQTLLRNSPTSALPLGSDFPVEGVNPLLGFYAAVSRLDVRGQSPHGPDGWYPEQRLSRAEALKGMTLDAAYASFAEHELGSLEPGKKADFVILKHNIMDPSAPFSDILTTEVLATVVDGRVVHGGFEGPVDLHQCN